MGNVVKFLFNRTVFFGIVFVLLGVILLLATPNTIDPTANSILRFPNDNPSLTFDLIIPTLGFTIVVAFIYLAGGAFAISKLGGAQTARARSVGLAVCAALLIPMVLVLSAAGKDTNIVSMLAASFRLATPIIIGAMAGIWCERSGVVNIAIEGMMLTGACFGYVTYTVVSQTIPGQSGLWLGVGIATIAGGLMALLHAWLSITFKTDQIISGTVINILALGLTSFIRVEVLVSSDASVEKLAVIKLPILGDLPVVGEVLFTGRPIFFLMFVIVIGTHVVLYYTRWGLRTRAVGENPGAADTLGIKVQRNRYVNVIAGGMIAGLAGAWFSLETAGGFDDGMTSGAGFIALAAMIFGKWTPFGAAAGGLLFGFAQALDTRFQLLQVPIPVQFVQMTPYIITMIILAGVVGRAVAPKAVGKPYEKE
ncbi:MAG: ABC transporter permease [bacterium]|nr:ABC transporter permease [bacterium]